MALIENRVERTADTRGSFCPSPVFIAKEAIAGLEAGQVLEVLADDPAAEEDLSRWASRAGHEVVTLEARDGLIRVLVRKIG